MPIPASQPNALRLTLEQLRTGRVAGTSANADLRTLFAPATPRLAEGESVLATFRGIGRTGRGREGVLDAFERLRLISADQRTVAGVGRGAVEAALDATQDAAFASSASSRSIADAIAASAAGSRNPIYRGLYAQSLMREAVQPSLIDDVVHVVAGGADDVIRAGAADDALRGAMSFSAGVDDTLRLLAKAARVVR